MAFGNFISDYSAMSCKENQRWCLRQRQSQCRIALCKCLSRFSLIYNKVTENKFLIIQSVRSLANLSEGRKEDLRDLRQDH